MRPCKMQSGAAGGLYDDMHLPISFRSHGTEEPGKSDNAIQVV